MPFARIDLAAGNSAGFRRGLADACHERLGLRREDVPVHLVDVRKKDGSFDDGEAQYA